MQVNVQKCKGSEILPYLQANNLSCFMDASRRHETPGSEIKDFTIHSKSSSQSVLFELVLQRGNTGGSRCMSVHIVGGVTGEEH